MCDTFLKILDNSKKQTNNVLNLIKILGFMKWLYTSKFIVLIIIFMFFPMGLPEMQLIQKIFIAIHKKGIQK